MNRVKYISISFFIFIISFAFIETALSWEGDPTHKDITEYAAKNSVLSETKGNYLKNLGFQNGLEEYFKWNERMTVEKWLQEGSALEDKGSFWQVITCQGRFMNHFHNPLTNKDGGTWGEWVEGGLDDYFFDQPPLYHLTGQSLLRWAQHRSNQSNFPEGDWTWQEARERYCLALKSKTNAERQENFARTFRALGHQLHLIQDTAVPAHVRNDAHPWVRRQS